jgi:Tol biopolymer transport system component/tRNA A-37 threonylcarbamoyl transferase component Bud32
MHAGQIFAHYRVTSRIAAGGMGEVFRATDTRLRREVALKALPASVAQDRDRLARFRREARVLASLNHPGIATIHGLESDGNEHALAMELVEGPDLSERLESGPLPVREALELALQLARALEYAHARGVVHRDFKPANVKVAPDGRARILDFGLAKVLSPDAGMAADGRTLTRASTAATDGAATRPGVLLGTAAYMAPEQARGEQVDARADVWAFGCLLYELLTGRILFREATVSDTIAAVLTREPDWDAVPSGTPPASVRLLRRCLVRDPRDRLHAMADARLEVQEALAEGAAGGPAERPSGAPGRRSRRTMLTAILAALAAGLLLGLTLMPGSSSPPPAIRALIDPPPGCAFDLHPVQPGPVAVSPDGARLAFSASRGDDPVQLWIRRLDALEAEPLPDTDGAAMPFWSPDGRHVAFFADSALKTIDIGGGPAVAMAQDVGSGWGGSWSSRRGILFGSSRVDGLQLIPAGGGSPVVVTEPDESRGERRHCHPEFLPDGHRFLYVAMTSNSDFQGEHRLMMGDLDGGEPRDLAPTFSGAQFAHGHLWYVADGVLMARPFDPEAAAFTGPAVAVADGVAYSGWAAWLARRYFCVAPAGVIAYHTGLPSTKSILTWYDRQGKELSTVGKPENQYHVGISPDGHQAALQVEDRADVTWALWLYDLARGVRNRLTFDPSPAAVPVWSRDGKRIAFSTTRTGRLEVFFKPAAGGEARRLLPHGLTADGDSAAMAQAFPLDWSPGDRSLVIAARPEGGDWDLWAVPLDTAAVPFRIRPSPMDEEDAAVSPDGRWLAYMSDEPGHFEIYVTDFPDGRHRWQVSSEGGMRPEWGPDGTELFFLDPEGTLMSVAIDTTRATFAVEGTHPLFQVEGRRYVTAEPGVYAVGPSAERFLVNRVIAEGSAAPLAVIVGWPEALSGDE